MKSIKNKIIVGVAFMLTATIAVFAFLYEPDLPIEQLKASYANEKSKFMEIDHMQVHYRVEGSGPTLILIHGTGAMLQTYDEWTKILSPHFTLIRMDIPAFGLTGPRADANYSDTMYVNFINRFAMNLGLDSFSLAGNSLGGLIAWKYAATFPKKVTKLILIDPGGFHELNVGKGSFVFNMSRNYPNLTRWISKIGTRYFIRNTLKEVFYDHKIVTEEKLRMYTDLNRRMGNRYAFTDRMQFVRQFDENDLRTINCPTLIMWGKEDVLINVGEAKHFKTIPNSSIILYDRVGHIPQEEIPDKSASDVLNFLKQ